MDGEFGWDSYLTKTSSTSVPPRAFKPRTPLGFKMGMKLECVDPLNPQLIRVASVASVKVIPSWISVALPFWTLNWTEPFSDTEKSHRICWNHSNCMLVMWIISNWMLPVQGYRLKIHFDGWSSDYDFWADDNWPDLHPTLWCNKSVHPLQPPLSSQEKEPSTHRCPTTGCEGIGHIEGAKYTSHNTLESCPYYSLNLHRESPVYPDRLSGEDVDITPVVAADEPCIVKPPVDAPQCSQTGSDCGDPIPAAPSASPPHLSLGNHFQLIWFLLFWLA